MRANNIQDDTSNLIFSSCPIVYCIDKNCIQYAQWSIESVLKHNPQANIIVVSAEEYEEFKDYNNIIVNAEELFSRFKFNVSDSVSDNNSKNLKLNEMVYLRVFLPEILPQYDKCLYIDADTLCGKSLLPLLKFEPRLIAAGIQLPEQHQEELRKDLGIVSKYINDGVMLMNLKALREDNFIEKILNINYHEQFKSVRIKCHEQTMINWLYDGKLDYIAEEFNYNPNYMYRMGRNNFIKALKENTIVHFVGKDNKTHLLHRIKDEPRFLTDDVVSSEPIGINLEELNKNNIFTELCKESDALQSKVIQKNNTPLIYCLDEGFIDYTEKSINTVLKYNSGIEIILLVNKRIPKFSQYRQIELNEELSKINFRFYTRDRLSVLTYARLFLPNLLREYKKCVYIDGDILCKGQLDYLFNLTPEYIAGVRAFLPFADQDIRTNYYISAGVLVLNLDNLRKDRLTEKIHFYDFDNYKGNNWLHDQTIINDLYRTKITPLPDKFNYQMKLGGQGQRAHDVPKDAILVHACADYNKCSFYEYYYTFFLDHKEKISCIMPFTNLVPINALAQTIDCVLNQSYTNIELLLINNSPQDEDLNYFVTQKAKTDSRIRYFNDGIVRNISQSRNYLMDKTQGEFVIFTDSDDLWSDNAFARMVSVLTRYPYMGMVISNMSVLNIKTGQNIISDKIDCSKFMTEALSHCVLGFGAIMFRKNRIQGLQFDETLTSANDYKFEIDALFVNRLQYYILDDYLFTYRKNYNKGGTGGCTNLNEQAYNTLAVIKHIFNILQVPLSEKLAMFLCNYYRTLKLEDYEEDMLNAIRKKLSRYMWFNTAAWDNWIKQMNETRIIEAPASWPKQ